jgi:hypothetical protein
MNAIFISYTAPKFVTYATFQRFISCIYVVILS